MVQTTPLIRWTKTDNRVTYNSIESLRAQPYSEALDRIVTAPVAHSSRETGMWDCQIK